MVTDVTLLRWIVILPLVGVLYHTFAARRFGRFSSSIVGPAVVGAVVLAKRGTN